MKKSFFFYHTVLKFLCLFSFFCLITVAKAEQAFTPKIQLAILLDTSNSMDGLIDQARNQLWQVVNEFLEAKKNGLDPRLEVAIFEYGNDPKNLS